MTNKDHQIKVRVTNKQKLLLESIAKHKDMTVSELIRYWIVRYGVSELGKGNK